MLLESDAMGKRSEYRRLGQSSVVGRGEIDHECPANADNQRPTNGLPTLR